MSSIAVPGAGKTRRQTLRNAYTVGEKWSKSSSFYEVLAFAIAIAILIGLAPHILESGAARVFPVGLIVFGIVGAGHVNTPTEKRHIPV